MRGGRGGGVSLPLAPRRAAVERFLNSFIVIAFAFASYRFLQPSGSP